MNKKFNRGFTLIELLVVIAIIGILSSVVLASLNTARSKGADAAVKSNLNNIRAQAELFYDAQSPNTYLGVCASSTTGIKKGSDAAIAAGGNGGGCLDVAAGWVAWAGEKAVATNAWCVDSTGRSLEMTKVAAAAVAAATGCQ